MSGDEQRKQGCSDMSSNQGSKMYHFAAYITVGIVSAAIGVPYSLKPNIEFAMGKAATIAQTKPNVVVIMVDDLSIGELNVALHQGWMPNLKRHVIDKGTTFTNSFVSNSLCCPSRATFLTGQYPHNHGVLGNVLPQGGVTKFKDNSTIATCLQKAGYRTGHVGKYLNGYGEDNLKNQPSDDPTYIPPGWDDWQATVGGSTYRVYNYIINDNGKLVGYGAAPSHYQTDILARRSVNFINESEQISDAKPFFLTIMPLAPHAEFHLGQYRVNYGFQDTIRPAPRHIGTAINIPLPKTPSFNEQDVSDKPAWLKNIPALLPQHINIFQKVYRDKLESVRAVDDLIGTVVSALLQNRELDNTVILFTSDNGFLFGEHRLRAKMWAYEEAIRVPLFIRAPGFSTPQLVGKFVINNDLAPTIADFAKTTPNIVMDGRSLIPLLKNPNLSSWRKRLLIEYWNTPSLPFIPTYSAVRTSSVDTATPNQLYVEYTGGEREFYDLTSDPNQLQSLHKQGGRRQQQVKILQNWLARLKACKGKSCQILENR
jgi:N-acetylglucosamine-6-sulfatase